VRRQWLHTPEYKARIASAEWQTMRTDRVARSYGRCERCRRYLPNSLELHHRHYDTLGHESHDDLDLLCPDCHELADEERELDQSTRHWWRRVEGWAEARGIDDWGEAEMDLEDFLEREEAAW
jgi:hypothetical protein